MVETIVYNVLISGTDHNDHLTKRPKEEQSWRLLFMLAEKWGTVQNLNGICSYCNIPLSINETLESFRNHIKNQSPQYLFLAFLISSQNRTKASGQGQRLRPLFLTYSLSFYLLTSSKAKVSEEQWGLVEGGEERKINVVEYWGVAMHKVYLRLARTWPCVTSC